ncbi:MAG: Na+/H+ antiporter subunit C [Rickettsia endosymbiont of Oxypoda opaca]|nr:Na+/H+ antiporter subunit C [Rickettsia endosymbiont of Oxypoda opaca]
MHLSIYFFALIILTCGLFIMLTSRNYVHKIIGLGVFQSSVLIFYLALGKINGGGIPIQQEGITAYSSPLPHVLMLTAIVVGFATLSVGLSLIYQIFRQFGTISEDEINFNDNK